MATVKADKFSVDWTDIASPEVKSKIITLMSCLLVLEWWIFIIQVWKMTWTNKLNDRFNSYFLMIMTTCYALDIFVINVIQMFVSM